MAVARVRAMRLTLVVINILWLSHGVRSVDGHAGSLVAKLSGTKLHVHFFAATLRRIAYSVSRTRSVACTPSAGASASKVVMVGCLMPRSSLETNVLSTSARSASSS